MKLLFLIPAIAFAVTSCNFANEEDYENLAKDACDCVNQATEGLSPRAKEILADSDGDMDKFQKGFEEYSNEDPMAALADATEMQKLADGSFESCINGLEKKYEDLYSTKSEEEIQQKILETLDGMDDCRTSAAIMRAGMAAK